MMDQLSLDPYEQQLLKVFDSHDRDNIGSLDREGLTQLCQTLQLEEQGTELVKCLLKDQKHSRATFIEFKDALLALLGNMQNNKNIISDHDTNKETEKSSPDREVSPKYVYGSKKYGRRSRPRNDEVSPVFGEQNDINYLNKSPNNNNNNNNTSVQRSNSQTEVSNSKKRKTNYKLKRCTSLPGNNDLSVSTRTQTSDNSFIASHTLSSEPEIICTEEMLREAWKKLGVGDDGYLNQTELVLVCDAIGLHKLADGVIRQLSDKLSINYDHKISFQELLEALQRDETWLDVLDTTPAINESLNMQRSTDNLFPDSRTFQYVTLGPDGNGIINTDTLIEMWESVGIHSPKELIHELGFNSRKINIIELADVLEKQIKGFNDTTRTEFQNPQIALLHANLTLYQSEIRCFKNVLEQMYAEREKLKYDVVEANNRATLLAQEVDDNHSRMEQNTLNQVKLLEQRHADILKEVTQQFSKDKEQLSAIHENLKERISCLEQETNKLKNDLLVAQKYSISVEKENQALSCKINELEQDKESLNERIGTLENEKQNYGEEKMEENELLLAKLSALQLENSQLKDKNDEMVSAIESLSNQVTTMRTKVVSTPTFNTLDQSMEENISIICEGVGVGAKRRSDYSPTKDNLFSITDGSPRLGKVRKFHKNKGDNFDVPFTSSESGFDTEIDCFDSSLSVSVSENEEITRLQAKVAFLEQILAQNSIPIPHCDTMESEATTSTPNISQLTERVKDLEKIIMYVKIEMQTMLDKNCVDSSDSIKQISQKLENILLEGKESSIDETFTELHDAFNKKTNSIAVETDNCDVNLEEKIKKIVEENKDLSAKCSELENCVELLRNEYERCEDYWQTKLDDERQMFEQEQKQNSEKLTDLIIKMKEYEEQFAGQDMMENRLPPIQETYNLEKQFTDLEQEYEDYKAQSEIEIFKKDEEITILKEKLTELALRQKLVTEASVQVDESMEEERVLNKMKTFSSYVVETTDRLPDQMLPPLSQQQPQHSNVAWSQNNSTARSECSEISSNSSSLPVNWNFNSTELKPQPTSLSTVPSTSSSSTNCLEKNSTPCRPKRTRKHDKNIYKKNNQENKDVKKTECNVSGAVPHQQDWKGFQTPNEQTVMMPISSLHSLNGRRNYLEQRVRHLQMCLKKQHYHTEQTLQYYWQQFKGEKADLHCKLKYCQEKLDQQVRICNEQLDRLERTDLLVKELYVENSYLIANVQRLEQQCHMLAQCNSNSSSV